MSVITISYTNSDVANRATDFQDIEMCFQTSSCKMGGYWFQMVRSTLNIHEYKQATEGRRAKSGQWLLCVSLVGSLLV